MTQHTGALFAPESLRRHGYLLIQKLSRMKKSNVLLSITEFLSKLLVIFSLQDSEEICVECHFEFQPTYYLS